MESTKLTSDLSHNDIQKILEENKKLKKQVSTYFPRREENESRIAGAIRRLENIEGNIATKRTAIRMIIAETSEDLKKYPENHFKKTQKSTWTEDHPRACINFNTQKCENRFMHKIQPSNFNFVFHYCCLCFDLLGSIENHPTKKCTLLHYMDQNPPSETIFQFQIDDRMTNEATVQCNFCNLHFLPALINNHILQAHPAPQGSENEYANL